MKRTLEDIYEMKDFYGVGEVRWNAIKHLTPIKFQELCNPDDDYTMKKVEAEIKAGIGKPSVIGRRTYLSILYTIHKDKLCSNCQCCEWYDDDLRESKKSLDLIGYW